MELRNKELLLLLKDLSARFPYGVICKSKYIEYDEIDGDDVEWDIEGKLEAIGDDYVIINSYQCELNETKPYLRPMSSMTEEECKEYRMFIEYSYNDFTSESTPCVYVDEIKNYINWLLAHHFDFRGLIPLDLALEAPKGMY